MSDNWKHEGTGGNLISQTVDALTGGVLGTTESVRNTQTGEVKEVFVNRDQSVGEAVEKGQFTDKDSSTWKK